MTTQIDASFDRIDPASQARVREAYQNAGSDPNGAEALAQIVALAGGAVAQGAAGTQAWPVGDAVAESTLAGILAALARQNLVYSAPDPQPPLAYRVAVSAPDCLPPPALGAGSAVSGGGLAPNTTYQIKVVAANAYGRTTPTQGTAITTGASTLTARQPIAAVAGATAYDIYLSADADPEMGRAHRRRPADRRRRHRRGRLDLRRRRAQRSGHPGGRGRPGIGRHSRLQQRLRHPAHGLDDGERHVERRPARARRRLDGRLRRGRGDPGGRRHAA